MGSTITTAFVFVLLLNVLMFSTQAAIMNINPEATPFCSTNGTLLESYTTGSLLNGNTTLDTEGFSSELPDSVESADESSSYGFLDTIATAKNWITNKVEMFLSLATAPNNFIKCVPGIPPIWANILSALWYTISVILLVGFIMGRTL